MCIDDILNTVEHLVEYLESEGYYQYDDGKKLEAIKEVAQKDASEKQNIVSKLDNQGYIQSSIGFFTQNGQWFINDISISFEFRRAWNI